MNCENLAENGMFNALLEYLLTAWCKQQAKMISRNLEKWI